LNDKLLFQEILENKFNGDFKALIEDVLSYAIEREEYEFAAIIRDELQNK
jgi:protein-arginine kinase activator protein McsA